MASRSSYNHLTANSGSPAPVPSTSRNRPQLRRRLHPFTVLTTVNTAIKDRQLSVLVLAFLVNLFFWCSLIYAILDIQNHHSHRTVYLAVSLLVFLLPSIVAVFLLLGPCPAEIKRWCTAFDSMRHSKNYLLAVNVLNAVLCLIILIVYLYASAIPQYENAQWENQFTYQQYLPFPSFALVDYNNFSIAGPGRFPSCYVSNYTSQTAPSCTQATEWTTIGGYSALLLNASKMAANDSSFNDLSSSIFLSTFWIYDTQRALNNSATPSNMDMLPIFFDSRMDLDTMYDCGLVGQATVPASGVYSISLTASYTTDKYGLITRHGQPPECVSASKALFDNDQSPYISYSVSVSSSEVTANCGPPENGTTLVTCVFAAYISYSTQMVQTTASSPGISKLDIVLNAGALVGGVQFFAWFLAMFAAP